MIYDCLQFYNEFDVLELRLRELADFADRVVIAEATVTYGGEPKPLYYRDNQERFAQWHDRITHVIIDDMPVGPDRWTRERHQREQILRGLREAAPTDVVVMADCDEIIDKNVARELLSRLTRDHWFGFVPYLSYYYLNCWTRMDDPCISLVTVQTLRALGPNGVRARRHFPPEVVRAGWHFSYLGGAQRVAQKIHDFAHGEFDNPTYRDPDHISACLETGRDIYGRVSPFEFIPIDERFPAEILQNPGRYRHLIREVNGSNDANPIT